MPSIEGVVTIVQEGRFQLIDDGGVAHMFLLSPNAAAETEQLQPLQRRQSRVQVWYGEGENVIGRVARSIRLLDDAPPLGG